MGMMVSGQKLELMILDLFSKLNDSVTNSLKIICLFAAL